MTKLIIPPIKCQGIKTKLVPFIMEHAACPENGLWIEPFMGSGAVAFNLAPRRALLADKNEYIIAFYQGIQNGTISTSVVREFLEYHGSLLQQYGEAYYRDMRDAFNENGDPLYFLFLNRSDFNGMIRFNRHGKFNSVLPKARSFLQVLYHQDLQPGDQDLSDHEGKRVAICLRPLAGEFSFCHRSGLYLSRSALPRKRHLVCRGMV